MTRFFVLIFTMVIPCSVGQAKDLGGHGSTFEITEPCLLTTLQRRLKRFQKEGKLEALQEAFQGRVVKSLERPRPVPLPKATADKRRLYDPSLTLSSDLKDMRGRVFASQGQVINPLDTFSFGADMLFFDGDDPDQLAWAKTEPVSSKWVLIKGAPLSLSKALGRAVFFDQGGLLSKKFGLQAVPARLRQEGRRLVIEEIFLEERGPHAPPLTRDLPREACLQEKSMTGAPLPSSLRRHP